MTEILKTKDYALFKKHECNRKIDKTNLSKLINSIKSNNLMRFRPILVDENYFIIDGQHRLEACKLLNLEVHYQLSNSSKDEDIILLNSNQKRWGISDYANFYISKGIADYEECLKFCKEKGISIELFVNKCLIGSRASHSMDQFKRGFFKMPSNEKMQDLQKLLDKTNSIINHLKTYVISENKIFLKSYKLKMAILSFVENEEVDFDLFFKKITMKIDCICQRTTHFAYYSMFKDIYNYRNSNPVL